MGGPCDYSDKSNRSNVKDLTVWYSLSMSATLVLIVKTRLQLTFISVECHVSVFSAGCRLLSKEAISSSISLNSTGMQFNLRSL